MSEVESTMIIDVELFKSLESKSIELSHQFAKQVESIQEQMKQVHYNFLNTHETNSDSNDFVNIDVPINS